jgi:hypothetical protein
MIGGENWHVAPEEDEATKTSSTGSKTGMGPQRRAVRAVKRSMARFQSWYAG